MNAPFYPGQPDYFDKLNEMDAGVAVAIEIGEGAAGAAAAAAVSASDAAAARAASAAAAASAVNAAQAAANDATNATAAANQAQAVAPELIARVENIPIAAGPQSDSYFDLVSGDGFFVGQIGQERLDFPTLAAINTGVDAVEIVDPQGFILQRWGSEGVDEQDISVRSVDFDCLELVAPDNFIVLDFMHPLEVSAEELAADVPLPSTIPYISRLLCGVQKIPVTIYVRNMLENRSDTDLVRGTVAAVSSPVVVSSNDELRVLTDELGAAANLYLRPERGDASVRTRLPLTVFTAPNPHPGPAPQPKILLIGDSIGNRQGAYLMAQYLAAWGYAPSFIGTMKGVGTSSENGPLGECREGWESGDFTNAVVDRSFPIAAGGEAAYMALPKIQQRDYNPFIRLSTGADDPTLVRNGYVLDFQYYCTRFGLDVPDIVIYALGTNDVRDQDASTIYDAVHQNDLLLLTRLRAAWPAAKIIRTLPGAPRDVDRDRLWSAKYIPVIKALLDAKNTLLDPKLYIAPLWAMTTQEAGWPMNSGAVDVTTGAITASWSDSIHLDGAARRQMYQALSGYVACAAVNLI